MKLDVGVNFIFQNQSVLNPLNLPGFNSKCCMKLRSQSVSLELQKRQLFMQNSTVGREGKEEEEAAQMQDAN